MPCLCLIRAHRSPGSRLQMSTGFGFFLFDQSRLFDSLNCLWVAWSMSGWFLSIISWISSLICPFSIWPVFQAPLEAFHKDHAKCSTSWLSSSIFPSMMCYHSWGKPPSPKHWFCLLTIHWGDINRCLLPWCIFLHYGHSCDDSIDITEVFIILFSLSVTIFLFICVQSTFNENILTIWQVAGVFQSHNSSDVYGNSPQLHALQSVCWNQSCGIHGVHLQRSCGA